MRVLVVSAHPDDEVLGCGGTIARLTAEGHEVHIVIVGEGATSRVGLSREDAKCEVAALTKHAEAARKVMGAQELTMLGLPDNRFDTLSLVDVIQPIEKIVAKYQPTRIFTHHGADLNMDHRITFQAVLTATRPMKGCPVKELFAFEVPSSTEWSFQKMHPQFTANTFFDISSTVDAKIQAMKCYASEMRPFPHPRSEEALRAIGIRWGTVVGCASAEAFETIRRVEI